MEMEKVFIDVKKCEFNWIAIYSEDDFLSQFSEEGEERTFGDIDQDRVVGLILTNEKDILGIDLETGVFSFNDRVISFMVPSKIKNKEMSKLRLIYFRKVRQTFSMDGSIWSKETLHCLGFQTSIEENINYKRIMGITEDGDLVIVED